MATTKIIFNQYHFDWMGLDCSEHVVGNIGHILVLVFHVQNGYNGDFQNFTSNHMVEREI